MVNVNQNIIESSGTVNFKVKNITTPTDNAEPITMPASQINILDNILLIHNTNLTAHENRFSEVQEKFDNVNSSIKLKADTATTYTKTEIDASLLKKIDASDSTVTKLGNAFNGVSQLVQLNPVGQIPALDGSLITNVGTKNITQIGTCTTGSATAEKTINVIGATLTPGTTIQVTFTSANTATAPTLNVNALGAKYITSEDGISATSTNPFFVPAGVTVEFTYNGLNWVYKNRVVTNYVNGTSWYKQWTNGYIEQFFTAWISPIGGNDIGVAVTLIKNFTNTNYSVFSNPYVTSNAVWGYSMNVRAATKTTSGFYATSSVNSGAYYIYSCGY